MSKPNLNEINISRRGDESTYNWSEAWELFNAVNSISTVYTPGVLITAFMTQKPEQLANETKSEDSQAEWTALMINARFRGLMDYLGIELSAEPVGPMTFLPISEEEVLRQQVENHVLNVTNLTKFADILKDLDLSQIKNNPEIETFLRILIDTIEKRITAKIMQRQKFSDQDYQDLSNIVNSLDRLNLYKRRLSNLHEAAQKQIIAELIILEESNLKLDSEPIGKGFGPSMWHRDMSEENYERRWQNAIATLQDIATSPKLYQDLHTHLIKSIDFALKDIDENVKASGNRITERQASHVKVLKKHKVLLILIEQSN